MSRYGKKNTVTMPVQTRKSQRNISSLGRLGSALGIFFFGFQTGMLVNNAALLQGTAGSAFDETSGSVLSKARSPRDGDAAKSSISLPVLDKPHGTTEARKTGRLSRGDVEKMGQKEARASRKRTQKKRWTLRARNEWRQKYGPFSCNLTAVAPAEKSTIFAWMHIPRTGGSSAFGSFMIPLEGCGFKTFPSSAYIDNGIVHDFNTPGCELDDHTWGTHCAASEIGDCVRKLNTERDMTPKVKFITFIRHPVDRVISEYYWWKDGGIPWTEEMHQLAISASLEDWVVHEKNTANNRQTLYFLIDEPFPKRGQCTAFKGEKTINWIEEKYGSTKEFNELQLSQVLANVAREEGQHIGIDDFGFIGILNDEATSRGFKKIFGVSPLLDSAFNSHRLSRRAEKERKLHVTDSIRELIEEKNKLDMQLYRLIQERLMKQL